MDVSSQRTRVGFPETQWSLVAVVREGESLDADAALEDLCRSYWPPLYQFVRRRGYPAHDAEDLTQSFFGWMLGKDLLLQADQEKGRMRSYLLTALQRYLANDYHRSQAQKRGGKILHLSFDTAVEESRLSSTSVTADVGFDQSWAITLLDQTINTLSAEYESTGKSKEFDVLKKCLTTSEEGFVYATAAEELEVTEGAIRVAAHRLRKRFRNLMRKAVAHTVQDPADVADEMRYLVEVLGAQH